MAEKKSGLKKLFSKSNKDCCSVEIEEVTSTEKVDCCDEPKNSENKNKEA